MCRYQSTSHLTQNERREQIAAILAEGVVQFRRIAISKEITDPPSFAKTGRNSLDFLRETRLSVSHGTRDLGLRDKGDEA